MYNWNDVHKCFIWFQRLTDFHEVKLNPFYFDGLV